MGFDDNRVIRGGFEALKPTLPFGALPTLDVDGQGTIAQSNAILRFIGRKHGLHPQEPFEAARHDAFMDAVEDLRHRISATMRIQDEEEKKAIRQQLSADYIPHWGLCVDRLITDGPFIGGELPSVADIKLFMVNRWVSSGIVDHIPTDIFDPFTKLKTVAANINNHPAVLKWYAAVS